MSVFVYLERLKDFKKFTKNMNKEKAKILEEAFVAGKLPEGCNDPELLALFKVGDDIKDSTFNNSVITADFKDRLKADILARRQTNAFSMKDKISDLLETLRAGVTRKRLYPALATLLLIAIITVTFKFWPHAGFSPLSIEAAYAHDNFTIETSSGGDLGINPDTQFIIKSKTAITDINTLRSNIKLSPAVDFDLKEVSKYEFNLIPKNNLTDKLVYRVTIASTYINDNKLTVNYNYSWAFQVKDKFKVVGSIPADRSSAPANTGIEITFSTENFENFESAFSISPATPGKFEKHNRTIVFVPAKPLTAKTLYTVNVNPSVSNSATGEKLSEAYHFQFEVQDDLARAEIRFTDDMAEFTTSQNPAFAAYLTDRQANKKVTTKIYNYHSLTDFTTALEKYYEIPNWAVTARSNTGIDYSSLSLVSSYELQVVSNDRGDFLVLPNSLPAGSYVVEATLGNSLTRTFVQVSDVSAYTSVTTNKILFWVNDISGSKLTDAKVTNLETKEVSVVNNNVATFDSKDNATTTSLFLVESAGKSLVVSVSPSSMRNSKNPVSDYWGYLYTDRSLYQPNDEINFWGFTKSRTEASNTFGKEITVSLVSDNYFNLYQEPIIVVKQTLTTDKQGFFIGKLRLNNLSPNGYRLKVQMDGKDLYSGAYLGVADYVKPAYKVTVTPSASAVFSGTKINYEVKASFFEGTPLVNNELAIEYQSGQDDSQKINKFTDGKGLVNLEYTPKCVCSSNPCVSACSASVMATPKLSEKGEIFGGANVTVFRAYTHFKGSAAERIAGQNRIKVKTNLLNIDLNNEKNNWDGAPVAGKSVNAKITEIEYIPTQTGTYYDFINKVTYPIYRYDAKRTAQPDKTFVTGADGLGNLEFEVNQRYSYEIKLITTDQYNNEVNDVLYFTAITSNNDPRYEYYSLVEQTRHGHGYNIGETVNLNVERDGQEILNNEGKFLFLNLQNGLRDYTISSEAKYSFNFSDKDLPNMYVTGVWFDGHIYHTINMTNIYFNKGSRKLEVSIKADQEKYQPGAEASLNISVKDKAGRGVKTHVNVSAVDIAMDSLGGLSDVSPLDTLYQSIDSGWEFSKYSHKNQLLGSGAEGGGGGGGDRSNFPDIALFTQVETDSDGQASLKFKLPDNITSWQLSAQAISNNLEAGATTTALKVSLPFFVEANFSKEYLAGDEPTIKAMAYGEILKDSGKTSIYLEAANLGISHDVKEVPAFAAAYFNLGKLKAGQYDFKVGSNYQDNKDAVINKITVVDSLLSQRYQVASEIKTSELVAGSEKNWTTINLMDNNRGRYYLELLNLSYDSGARVDQKLSAVVANNLMHDYFGVDNKQELSNLKIYQTSDGGISLLPYSSVDIKLSVLTAMTAPDSFDRNALAGYFYGIYNNDNTSREEMSLALSGLAALNEPVLISLREFNKNTDLTPSDKLYLALGAKTIGDNELAQNIYNELMSKYGEELNPYLRLKIDNKNNDNNISATALVSVLAVSLDDVRAEKLWNYVKDNRPEESLTDLERLLYLRQAIPMIPAGDSKFTVSVDNQTITKELKRGENYLFSVSPEQLKTLKINILSGSILAVSDYDVTADVTKQNKAVKISKEYFNKNIQSNNFKESDVVEIRLKPEITQAVDGSYEITDILPSGLKLLTNTYNRGIEGSCGVWYPYEVSGQKVKFIIDKNWNKSGGCSREDIRYFARVSQPGKYIVEPALIQSVKATDLKSFSSGGQIIISQ
jgi:hypothetical protein